VAGLPALPDINFVAAANLSYGVDELAEFGGIRNRPVDVVRCKRIPLQVPADAEIVITSAPLMIDLLHNMPFVLGCDYKFADRFDAQRDYFVPKTERKELGGFINWESNFIADARAALIDPSGFGVRITSFDMGGSTLVGHIAEWPVGRYHKAHFHQGGAILLILRSRGYTLMWPQEAGLRPYQSGMAIRWSESIGAKAACSALPALGSINTLIPARSRRGNWRFVTADSRENIFLAVGGQLTSKVFTPALAKAEL
jgi:hypothetical protein